jgi:hypothetical protein
MMGLAGASTLCRVLMTLGRTGATGRLRADARTGRGFLCLREGCITAVGLHGSESMSLGEVLDAYGAWDETRHAEALRDSDVASPVGAWLVRNGVSSEAAVAAALRAQAVSRVQVMCGWDALELSFEPGQASGLPQPMFEPLPTPSVIIPMLRAWVPRADLVLSCARLTGKSFQLSAAGRALLAQRDILREPEERLLVLLGDGTPVEQAVVRSGSGQWGFGFVRALELIAAIELKSHSAYPLLLQKRRQIREAASPHTLLDLPPGAGPQEARKALRRLVSDLHPDRLGTGVPEALHRVCSEVIRALVAADSSISESS